MLKRLIVAALILLIPRLAAAGIPMDTAKLGVENILKSAGPFKDKDSTMIGDNLWKGI